MLKYTSHDVVFQELPDEISLAFNIANCPFNCFNCHTPELKENIGKPLNMKVISKLLEKYPTVTCIIFFGGDKNPGDVWTLFHDIKSQFSIKTCWYSGRKRLEPEYTKQDFLSVFDYIKLGPYIEEKGPLNKETTNQRMYMKNPFWSIATIQTGWEDITYKFWK